MARSSVHSLLGAVRRHLWRGQFVVAARLALWGTAGLMLFAAAVHLAARPVSFGAVAMALAVLWAALLARAGWRRPNEPACALWADRHLGGASAFTTWLETGGGPRGANAQALQWLERWAAARVPQGMELLAGWHEAPQLSRPLLSALMCAALATFVLTLGGPAPSPRQQVASRPATDIADRPLSGADAPAAAERVSEVAMALRPADPDAAPERGQAPRVQATASGTPEPGSTAAVAAALPSQTGTTTPGPRTSAGEPPVGTAAAAAAPATAATLAAGTGSGRDAGDSRDDRADIGVSQPGRVRIPVPRFVTGPRRAGTEERADMDRSATYDDDLPGPGTAAMAAVTAPAPAAPPAAAAGMRLRPTEATYVQAWLKASGRRR